MAFLTLYDLESSPRVEYHPGQYKKQYKEEFQMWEDTDIINQREIFVVHIGAILHDVCHFEVKAFSEGYYPLALPGFPQEILNKAREICAPSLVSVPGSWVSDMALNSLTNHRGPSLAY